MIDIVETATRVASSGLLVKMRVLAWVGYIPPRMEWGDRYICAIPDDAKMSVGRAKRKIRDTFHRYTIPCLGWGFMRKAAVNDWIKEHEEAKASLAAIVDVMANSVDSITEAARYAASSESIKVWTKNHPTEGNPPSSTAYYAANLAASLVPSKDEIKAKFDIIRSVNTHYFLATNKMDFLSDGEKRGAAWRTLDELVAGNARLLHTKLDYAMTCKDGHKRRLLRTAEAVISFKNTDIMPELGLSDHVDELYNVVCKQVACEIPPARLISSIGFLMQRAKELATASDVIRRLNG